MAKDPVAPDQVERVAVLGAGTIGASWTALFLAHGMAVDVFDVAPDAEAKVRGYVENAWPALERLGLAANADPDRVAFHGDAKAAVREAQFVQENVPERLEIKHATYREIEPALAPGALVSTSASGLMIKNIGAVLEQPERLFLAHPFNPPHLIPLVELLGTESAVAWGEGFYARCNKTTIRLMKEVPGHVANRLQAALWREAINLVVEGVATVEDVDKAIVHGPGLRWAIMGPHMLFSLASSGEGIEVFCDRFGPGIQSWWEDLGSPDLGPSVRKALADGVKAEEAGRSFENLAAERDVKLVELIRTLAAIDAERS